MPLIELRRRNDGKAERGAVAVEFALVCILLMIMIVGMVEIGRLYGAQLALTHAAREGARLASVNKFSIDAVRQHAAPLPPTAVVVGGPTVGTDAAGAKSVTVTVTYPFQIWLLGADWLDKISTITLTSSAVMRAEY